MPSEAFQRTRASVLWSLVVALVSTIATMMPTYAETAVQPEERQALIDLYESTNGEGWYLDTNWRNADGTGFNDIGTECTWYGIWCQFDAVISVSLVGINLTGTIPPSLAVLSRLEYLRLRHNNLTGPIPPELSDITSLLEIDLSDNELDGPIPHELDQMSSLQSLNLGDNRLTGTIPHTLTSIQSLRVIGLGGNQLTGSIPPGIAELKELRVLSLESNQLTGRIPPELGRLPALEYLFLGSNQLSGPIPPKLGHLPELRTLDLSHNQLTGQIPPDLANLAFVKTLDLSSNLLSGNIPSTVGDLESLSHLYLQSNRLAGTIPPELGNLWLLKDLVLGSNHLEGPIPPELGSLNSLWVLDLSANRLNGSIPASLSNLQDLENHGSDIGTNALWTDNPAVQTLLQRADWDWIETQTVAPSNLEVLVTTATSIVLGWQTILYADPPGAYAVFIQPRAPSDAVFHDGLESGSTNWWGAGNPWVMTLDKTEASILIDGLEPAVTYRITVRTITDPHADNLNPVLSDPSDPVNVTTRAP